MLTNAGNYDHLVIPCIRELESPLPDPFSNPIRDVFYCRVLKFSLFSPAVPQAKAQLYLRTHMADESKNEYAAQLQNFNGEQWKHFNAAIPQIFKVRHLAP